MKIYVPQINNNNCAVLNNGEVLRIYETRPTQNADINYTDYYINSHYISNNGIQHFSQYTSIPSCIDNNALTTNIYYRFDLDQILICFIIIVLFCFYFPYKFVSRLFGRWLKL